MAAVYTYSAWGAKVSVKDAAGNNITSTSHVAHLNPFRYRGYMYDEETGFYYLRSRYYNPEMGRSLSADGYVSTGVDLDGYNMFAYCGNNPIIFTDPNGDCPWTSAHIRNCIVGNETCADFNHNAKDSNIEIRYRGSSEVLCVTQTIIGEAGGRLAYPDDWKQGARSCCVDYNFAL